MVNKKNMQRWVDALESGDYLQGKGQLREDNRFCCLGVACDIAAQDGKGHWEGNIFVGEDERRDSAVLPPKVAIWLGIIHLEGSGTPEEPDAIVDGKKVSAMFPLTSLNDDYRYDFLQIAQVIRDRWLSDEGSEVVE